MAGEEESWGKPEEETAGEGNVRGVSWLKVGKGVERLLTHMPSRICFERADMPDEEVSDIESRSLTGHLVVSVVDCIGQGSTLDSAAYDRMTCLTTCLLGC